jgi:hypothetical protein
MRASISILQTDRGPQTVKRYLTFPGVFLEPNWISVVDRMKIPLNYILDLLYVLQVGSEFVGALKPITLGCALAWH